MEDRRRERERAAQFHTHWRLRCCLCKWRDVVEGREKDPRRDCWRAPPEDAEKKSMEPLERVHEGVLEAGGCEPGDVQRATEESGVQRLGQSDCHCPQTGLGEREEGQDSPPQTAEGEGVEKMEGVCSSGQRGEREGGPQSWSQEEGLPVAPRLPANGL
ncbi:hypothetical protein GBAR_LOCUS10153 [Geodia barretti]|uniref:Uncharacterized protein n=1 Tax=Geodia barretti TaxID=519541 RepID=A0AA35RTG9_GEOBA|nr:hypothetical protein GBAR_LOCUS10153 [Geodia barretti]